MSTPGELVCSLNRVWPVLTSDEQKAHVLSLVKKSEPDDEPVCLERLYAGLGDFGWALPFMSVLTERQYDMRVLTWEILRLTPQNLWHEAVPDTPPWKNAGWLKRRRWVWDGLCAEFSDAPTEVK